MTEREIEKLEDRVRQYRNLEIRECELRTALEIMHDGSEGPCGQHPFTGNTRESRRVRRININFTETLGGAKAVSLELNDLNLPAPEFGRFLEEHLYTELDAVMKAKEEL